MMAFGDNFNDLEMLQYVGHPYLIESGRDEIEALVPGILRCRNVADVLEGLLGCSPA